MPTINQLSAVSELKSGDQFPIWVPTQGDTRKGTLGQVLTYVKDNLLANTGISQTTDPGDTGFWPDVTATTKIQRVRDRMFLNDGASFTGNFSGTQDGFVPTSTEGANWASRDSSMFVAQDSGLMAVTGFVSNTNIDTAVGMPDESIGVSGFAIGNKANRPVWSLYGDVQFTQGTYAYGLELAVKNLEGANRISYPYAFTVGTYGIWLAGGGDSSYGGAPTNPCNTAIAIGKNSSTWNTGILFQATGITGTDGVTGTGNAISMAKGHVVSWYNSSNQQCATIYSDATTFAARAGIQFVDNGLWFTKAGALSLQLDFSAGTANYAQISSSATANPVTVQASGSDTNIDLRLLGKGTGRVQFGTHTGTADTAISGYIEIKDASGTVRKLAVIS